MTLIEVALILAAAVGAGALNAVVGAGTLITFSTLLALGYPAVLANVSNTVGLVPGGVSAAYAYRETLRGRARVVRRLMAATMIGGVTGAALLLALPARAFEVIVPVLLVMSGVLAAIQPRVAAAVGRRRMRQAQAADPTTAASAPTDEAPTSAAGDAAASAAQDAPTTAPPIRVAPLLIVGVGLTGIYGGYFGAAQGVILLALLGVFLGGDMNRVNGIKNILAGLANLVSALLFIAIADIAWGVVAIIAVGATIGGGVGGRYGRRLPAPALRGLVVVVAFTAAGWQIVR